LKRVALLLACLAVPAPARADAKKERPVLVLDPGGHTARVMKVTFTKDGKQLISVAEDKTIRFWDVRTGEALRTLRPPLGKGQEGALNTLALSPAGGYLAVAGIGKLTDGSPVYVVSLATGRIVRVLKGSSQPIFALAFSRNGKYLAAGGFDGLVRIWEVRTGTLRRTLRGHKREVYAVAFAPDGKKLLSASLDGRVGVWDLSTSRGTRSLSHFGGVRALAWSPDGKAVATGGVDQAVRLWAADGKALRTFTRLGSMIDSVAFSRDSRFLLFTRSGAPGLPHCSLVDLDTGRERLRYRRHTNTVMDGVFSPDGTLAATADAVGEVHLWRTADGALVHRLAGRGKTGFSTGWSKDAQTLAWGTTFRANLLTGLSPLERTFRLTDLELGPAPAEEFRRAQTARDSLRLTALGPWVGVMRGSQLVARLTTTLDHDQVRCGTFLPGDRVAVGANYGLYLYDARSAKALRSFQGHTGVVTAVSPSFDDRYLLSSSNDQTLRVWLPDQDEPLLSLFVAGDDWVAWTPEGYYAASPGGERLMGWQVNNGPDKMGTFYPTARFRKSLYRPDVIQRLLKAGSVARALELADRGRGRSTRRHEVAKVLPPVVAITTPTPGSRLRTAQLQVKATAASPGGHPITRLRLLVNGRPHGGERRPAGRAGTASADWTVSLTPGRHRLTVQADSTVSQGLSDEVLVSYTGGEREPDTRLPDLYILAVGVTRYKDEKLRLNYATGDAQKIADTFKGKSKTLFRKIQTKVLTDKEATRTNILKGLTWLRREVTQKDYAVVFFSGHGDRDGDGNLYLLPVDVDPDDLLASSVSGDAFRKSLAALSGKVLCLLDACHSGGIDGKRKSTRSLTDDLVRDLTAEENGVVVMCSSTGREFSLENNELRMGNFTAALVEGLSGKAARAANGAVYLHHLDAYVTDRVKALSKGRQHPVTSRPSTIASFPLARP
jgi:WD40 repeat protein